MFLPGKNSLRSKTGLKGLKNVITGSRCSQCHQRARSIPAHAVMDGTPRARNSQQTALPRVNSERSRSPGRPAKRLPATPGGPRDPYDYLRRTQLKTNDEWDTYWDYTTLLAINNNKVNSKSCDSNNNNNSSNNDAHRAKSKSPRVVGGGERFNVPRHGSQLIGGSVGRHSGSQLAAFAAGGGFSSPRARAPGSRGGGSPPPTFGMSSLGDRTRLVESVGKRLQQSGEMAAGGGGHQNSERGERADRQFMSNRSSEKGEII